jgi:hypothetical protein
MTDKPLPRLILNRESGIGSNVPMTSLYGVNWSTGLDAVLNTVSVVPVTDSRSVFVGYPYELPKDDYRGLFYEVGGEYGVEFVFADEKLTQKHILEKIAGMMAESAFSLFDITLWNPNVALELGLAYGAGWDFYILFDPTKGNEDVLTDVKGIDRIEYRSYSQLKEELSKLIREQFGSSPEEQERERGDLLAELESLRERLPSLLKEEPGQTMGSIASSLEVPIDVAQMLVRPLVGVELETRGEKRGTRYYVMGDAPDEEPESEDAEG